MTATPRPVSAAAARRFLVRRHLLAPPRALPPEPGSVMRVVDRLGSLQFDPIDVAGRNHDLTLLSRIRGYRREWTDGLLYADRVLYETYNKMLSIVPTAELPYFRLTWDRAHDRHREAAFDEHAPLVEELLERMRSNGPLSSTDIETRPSIDWYWRPTNQVRAILEALAEAGIIAISRREGNRRVYDLAERLFAPELLAQRPDPREQRRHKLLSRYRGNGLLGATGDYTLWAGIETEQRASLRDELIEMGELVAVSVEGLRGSRFVIGSEVPILDEAEREVATDGGTLRPADGAGVAFIAPLDPLAWDRDLLERLFGFYYRWEVYVPLVKRQWGYYVLPLLFGDRFVGRIELKADRPAKSLRVLGIWWQDGFEPMDEANVGFVDGFVEALGAHLAFTGMRKLAMPRVARHRALAAAVRERL